MSHIKEHFLKLLVKMKVSACTIVNRRKSHYYPSWILNATTPSDQNTAISTCFHSLKRVSPRTKEAPNKVVL